MNHWGMNWATVGEIMRFLLACSWIAVITVVVVKIFQHAAKVYEERIRWWR